MCHFILLQILQNLRDLSNKMLLDVHWESLEIAVDELLQIALLADLETCQQFLTVVDVVQ